MAAFREQFGVWVDRFLTPVDDPGSRLFHLNLISTFALIALWILFSQGWSLRGLPAAFRKAVFRKKYWWNRSTKVDYQVYALNSVLKVFLFIPLLDLGFFFSRKTARLLLAWNNGDFPSLNPTWPLLLAFTLGAFVFDDFLRFFQHLLMHKVPFLWKLHRVHHSARVLTPITLYRAHPLESALATLRNSLSLGVATGAFLFLFEARYNLLTFFGVNVLGFTFNLLGANLRHSHVPLSFGFLERIFISPKQHQVHHSRDPRHFDKNFGVSLSVWDWLSGSLVRSHTVKGKISVGLDRGRAGSLGRQMVGTLPSRAKAAVHNKVAAPKILIENDYHYDTP